VLDPGQIVRVDEIGDDDLDTTGGVIAESFRQDIEPLAIAR
jgi:hypothetical protein